MRPNDSHPLFVTPDDAARLKRFMAEDARRRDPAESPRLAALHRQPRAEPIGRAPAFRRIEQGREA